MSEQLTGGGPSQPRKADVTLTQAWWIELGLEVIRACLVAASGILVKELVERVGHGRREMYDLDDEL